MAVTVKHYNPEPAWESMYRAAMERVKTACDALLFRTELRLSSGPYMEESFDERTGVWTLMFGPHGRGR